MIDAMTTTITLLFTVSLLLALAALRHWARNDRLSTRGRPGWFD